MLSIEEWRASKARKGKCPSAVPAPYHRFPSPLSNPRQHPFSENQNAILAFTANPPPQLTHQASKVYISLISACPQAHNPPAPQRPQNLAMLRVLNARFSGRHGSRQEVCTCNTLQTDLVPCDVASTSTVVLPGAIRLGLQAIHCSGESDRNYTSADRTRFLDSDCASGV